MSWIVLAPIVSTISWLFMNAVGVLSPGDTGIPYPAYLLISTTIWGLFMNFYTAATQTLNIGASYIWQVKFPHHILLVKQALQTLVSFYISFVVILLGLLIFNVTMGWGLLLSPLLVLPLFFLGSAIGIIVSIFSVLTMDVQAMMTYLLGLVMFITPVIYASDIDNPTLQQLMRWNPLTYLIGGFRDMIVYGHIAYPHAYLVTALLALVLFLFAWRLFYISEEKVIEKMI